MWGDENMPYQGFEDWEFWLIGTQNAIFSSFRQSDFKYFVRNSMVRSLIRDGYF
jgi:hypothetical protein